MGVILRRVDLVWLWTLKHQMGSEKVNVEVKGILVT